MGWYIFKWDGIFLKEMKYSINVYILYYDKGEIKMNEGVYTIYL